MFVLMYVCKFVCTVSLLCAQDFNKERKKPIGILPLSEEMEVTDCKREVCKPYTQLIASSPCSIANCILLDVY